MKNDELEARVRAAAEATKTLLRKNAAGKNELLFARGINFNDVPLWQRRGTGVRWETFERAGVNPRTGEAAVAPRRRIARDEQLPMADDYRSCLRQFVGV